MNKINKLRNFNAKYCEYNNKFGADPLKNKAGRVQPSLLCID